METNETTFQTNSNNMLSQTHEQQKNKYFVNLQYPNEINAVQEDNADTDDKDLEKYYESKQNEYEEAVNKAKSVNVFNKSNIKPNKVKDSILPPKYLKTDNNLATPKFSNFSKPVKLENRKYASSKEKSKEKPNSKVRNNNFNSSARSNSQSKTQATKPIVPLKISYNEFKEKSSSKPKNQSVEKPNLKVNLNLNTYKTKIQEKMKNQLIKKCNEKVDVLIKLDKKGKDGIVLINQDLVKNKILKEGFLTKKSLSSKEVNSSSKSKTEESKKDQVNSGKTFNIVKEAQLVIKEVNESKKLNVRKSNTMSKNILNEPTSTPKETKKIEDKLPERKFSNSIEDDDSLKEIKNFDYAKKNKDFTDDISFEENENEYEMMRQSRRSKNSNKNSKSKFLNTEDEKDLKKNTIFNKNLKWSKKKDEKVKKMRIDKENKELDGCTFRPEIGKSSENILKKSEKYYTGLTVFEKNMIWRRNVEKNIQNKHLIQERKIYQECIFEPQISKDPILLRSKSLKNDGMYIKNLEWKNAVEEKRKNKIKDNENKLKKDASMFHKSKPGSHSNSLISSMFKEKSYRIEQR